MKTKLSYFISELLNGLFVLLFVYAGFHKLSSMQTFRDQLVFATGSELFSSISGYVVPVIELVIALLLCFRKTRLAGLYGFVSMMTIFSFYIAYLLLSGRNLPCSCGGIIDALSWKQHLVFNGCFLVAGIAAIIIETNRATYHLPDTKKSF